MTRSQDEVLRDALEHFRLMQDYAQRDLAEQLVIDHVGAVDIAITAPA